MSQPNGDSHSMEDGIGILGSDLAADASEDVFTDAVNVSQGGARNESSARPELSNNAESTFQMSDGESSLVVPLLPLQPNAHFSDASLDDMLMQTEEDGREDDLYMLYCCIFGLCVRIRNFLVNS
jgi:hypothetical protein